MHNKQADRAKAKSSTNIAAGNKRKNKGKLAAASLERLESRQMLSYSLPGGTLNSVAYDAAGNLHVAYINENSGALKYAVRNAQGTWTTPVTIDSVGTGANRSLSLAVRSDGLPCVAYYDSINQDLKYAASNGSTWSVSKVDSAGNVGVNPSLAFNNVNTAYVSYYDATNKDLRLAQKTSTGWTLSSPVTAGDVGKYSSVLINPAGQIPRVIYSDTTAKQVRVYRSGASSTDVLGTGNVASLAAYQTSDRTHFMAAWFDTTTNSVKFGDLAGAVLTQRTLASSLAQSVSDVSLVKSGGNVLATWGDTATGRFFKSTTGTSPVTQVVGAGESRASRVAVAPDGRLTWTRTASNSVIISTENNPTMTATVVAPDGVHEALQGTSITLRANAATSNGTVVRVDFYDGQTLLGSAVNPSAKLPSAKLPKGSIAPSTPPSLTYLWTGASLGLHSITAVAIDNEGAEKRSAVATVNVIAADTTRPQNVSGVAASRNGENVDVTWNAVDDNIAVTQYVIYRDGVQIGVTAAGTLSYSDTAPLFDGAAHVYGVKAKDAAGNLSATAGTASLTLDDLIAPTAATLSLVSAGETTITLNWTGGTDAAGITGWRLYRGDTQVGDDLPASTTQYTDTDLAIGGSYEYTLVAFDAAGNVSDPSNTVSASTADHTAPTAPVLSTTGATSTTISLSWTASTDNVDVTGYRLYRDGVQVVSLAPNVTSCIEGGLVVNTSYAWKLTAVDAAGNESDFSNTVTVSTVDTTSPTAPTISSTGVTSTSIDLSWTTGTDNVGVTGYRVYRGGTLIATQVGTTFTDTGLTVNTQYTYTVEARDAAGNWSALSTGLNVSTVDTTAPNAPTGLNSTGSTETTVDLSWTAPTDNVAVTGYKVYKGGVFVADVTSGTSYTVTGLTVNTAYAFTVKAFDAAGNLSAVSNTCNVTTPDTTAPAAITDLSSTGSTETSVSLSWSAPSDNVAVTGYRIYKNGVQIADQVGTTYTANGLTVNTAYTFTVKAYDAANNLSAVSNSLSVTTPDLTAPNVPTGLNSTGSTETTVDLSWTAPTDNVAVTGYKVYKGGVFVADVTSGTSYTVTGLTVNTAYAFTVKAFDAAGNLSAVSNTCNVTTPDTTAPAAITDLSSTGSTETSVSLSWSAPSDNVAVTGYKIYKNGVLIATQAGTSYTATGLTVNTAYTFTVKAYDAANNLSAVSNSLSVTTPDLTAPNVPTGLNGTGSTETTVDLSWTAPTDNVAVTGYKIYKDGVFVADVTSGTSYTVTGLAASTTYAFAVKAYDAANNISAASTACNVTTPDVTAPSSPTLSHAGGTSTTIALSWSDASDNVGVAGYRIYRDSVQIGSDLGAGTTTFTDTGLTLGNTHVYVVEAFDAAGNVSNLSNALTLQVVDTTAPAAPTNLHSTGATETTIDLAWNAATDDVAVTGYKVYKNGVFVANVTNGTTYTVTGLTVDTAYTFTVKAFDAANNLSAASAAVSVTTPDTTAPDAITDLSSTGSTETTVSLSWSAPSDNVAVTGYKVYKGGVFVADVTSGTSYTVTGLTVNTAYAFTVKAFDAAGNLSAVSNTCNVTTPDQTAPNVPTNLHSTAASETSIALAWTAPSDNVAVTGYKIYKNGVEIADQAGTTYTATGLTVGTSYDFTVKAYDAANNLSAASAVCAVATPDLTDPSAPTGLNSTGATETTVTLSWTAATDNVAVTGYKVFKGGVLVANVIDGTSYTVTGLTVNTAYAFTVRAFDAANNLSAASNTCNVTTPDQTAPNAPTALNSSGSTETTVDLAWTAPTDNVAVTGYKVYKGGVFVADVTNGTSYTVTGLTANTAYVFTVKAFDAANNLSAASNTCNVTTPDTTAPAAITDLSSTGSTETSVSLSWSAATDNVAVTGYKVYKGGVLVTTINDPAATSYTVTGLTVNTAYAFTVKAFDAAGNLSNASNVCNVTTPDTTAPAAIADLSSTGSTETSVSLSWSAPSDNVAVTGYKIYKNGVQIADQVGTTYTANGLTVNTAYTFTVKAYDAANNLSAVSNSLSVTTPDTTAPDAITDLSSTGSTETTVSLSWSAPSDNVAVTGYKVYKGGVFVADVTSGTSYTVTGLTVNTAYAFTVKAFDAAGNLSAVSNTCNVTTPDTTAPAAITDLSSTGSTETSVSLSWSAPSDNVAVTGYKIYKNGVLIADQVGTTYTANGLTVNTAYTFTVKAYDAANNLSAVSNSLSVTTPDTTAPDAITDLSSTGSTETTVSLSWSAPSDNVAVTGYKVYKGGVFVADVTSGTSYTVTGLTVNTAYAFTVKAFDAAGNLSAVSNTCNVTTPDTTAPAAITDLSSTGSTETSVSLSWSAPSDNVAVTGYRIYKNGVLIADQVGTTYTANGLTVNTAYTFTVKAYDAANNLSAVSNSLNVTTPDTTAPNAPVASDNGSSGTTAMISWTAPNDNVGVTGYKIYRGGVLIATVGATPRTYSQSGLSTDTTYQYTVTALDAAGNESVASNAVAVVTPDTIAPTAPSNLSMTDHDSSTVSLGWTASTDAYGVVGYNIYRDGTLWGYTDSVSYVDMDAADGELHQYHVTALDAAGNESQASATVDGWSLDVTPPSAPGLSSPSAHSTTVDLSWTASTDNVLVTGYKVYKDGVLVTTINDPATRTYTVTGLTVNTAYAFTVKAIDGDGNASAASNTVNVTTPDTTAPDAITDLSSTGATSTSVSLSWSAPSDNMAVTGYKIYKNGVQIADQAGTTYTANGLTVNTAYTFTVKAYDAANNLSAVSNSLSVTTPDTTAPAAITDLSSTGATSTTVSLSWSAPSDNVAVTGYKVYKGGVLVTTINDPATTSYTVTGLTVNTAYAFTVKAFDAAGNLSNASNVCNVTTPDTTAPDAVTDLSSTGSTETSVSLSWSAPSDNMAVTGYKIYKNGVLIADQVGTTYTANGLTVNTAYTFTVKAYDAANNLSAVSNSLNVTTPDTTAPAAITDLSSTGSTETTVSLSWTAPTDNVGVVGYRIYNNGVYVDGCTSTSLTLTGLTVNTAYAFTVKAFDVMGNLSNASNVCNVTTPDLTAPAAPGNFSAAASDLYIDLTWQAPADNVGVTGYKVFRDGTPIATLAAGTLSYQDTGLALSHAYEYTVEARDAAGNWSTDAIVDTSTTADSHAPSAPTSPTLVTRAATSIRFSWTASTDNVAVAGYKVYRNGTYIGFTKGTQFIASGLTANTAYTFTVKAYDAANNLSAASTGLTASTDVTAPSAVVLSSPGQADNAISLSWTSATDNVGVAGYKVYRDNVLIATINGAGVTSYTATGLTASTSYDFLIKAFDAAGNSTDSNVLTESTTA